MLIFDQRTGVLRLESQRKPELPAQLPGYQIMEWKQWHRAIAEFDATGDASLLARAVLSSPIPLDLRSSLSEALLKRSRLGRGRLVSAASAEWALGIYIMEVELKKPDGTSRKFRREQALRFIAETLNVSIETARIVVSRRKTYARKKSS